VFKLSIFVPITKPEYRQDPWRESILNFTEFADEVVIVCGDESDLKLDFPNPEKIKLVYNKWRSDDYTIYGEQYEKGFNATTGDWVIKCDPDYLFHENDWEDIRYFLEEAKEDYYFMPKKQFILADRFRVKAVMPIVFRGNLRNQIKFIGGGDYTWPQLDGKDLEEKKRIVCKKEYVVISDDLPDYMIQKRLPDIKIENGMKFCLNRRIPVWNYDFTFKTNDIVSKEFLKQSKARYKKTGSDWGQTKDKALEYLINMQLGRLSREGWEMCNYDDHPKHIQEKIKNIKPDQLGFNLFSRFDI
jgi:hypothetical protein